MTRFYADLEVLFRGHSRSEMEDLFESLADAVYDLSDVIDPDLAVDLGRNVFEFSMAIDAEDERQALQIALNAARAALHSNGACTAGWENYFEIIRRTVWNDPAELADA